MRQWRGRPCIELEDLNHFQTAFTVPSSSSEGTFCVSKKQKLSSVGSKSVPGDKHTGLLQVSSVLWVITGKILLSNRNSCVHSTYCGDCLALTDGTATACCLLKNVDSSVLARSVVIPSFNFIPVKGQIGNEATEGFVSFFIEVQELRFLDESVLPSTFPSLCLNSAAADCRNDMLETPPPKARLGRPRFRLQGYLHCLSPSFVLPYQNLRYETKKQESCRSLFNRTGGQCSNTKGTKGFFLELQMCQINHPNTNRLEGNSTYVYFSGHLAAWHPVLVGLTRRWISLTGLRRKLIKVGSNVEHYFIFAATRTTLVSPANPPLSFGLETGNSTETGSYVGVVNAIHHNGRLIELDDQVQLILTHQQHVPFHCLRIGATILVQNVHIFVTQYGWTKFLMLGACTRSTIQVILFSPLDTPLQFCGAPQNIFDDLQHFPFDYAFWYLRSLSSFRHKFPSLCCDENPLASKQYDSQFSERIQNHPTFVSRDVVKEFILHDRSCFLRSHCSRPLANVPTLLEFSRYIGNAWDDQTSFIWQQTSNYGPNANNFTRCIIPSTKMNIRLVGCLQASSITGNMELVDATHSIAAIVPDFYGGSFMHQIYEVLNFSLIVEGHSGSAFTCFGEMTSFYVVFHLKDSVPLNMPMKVPSQNYHAGKYTVILLRHKHPIRTIGGEHLVFMAEGVLIPVTIHVYERESECPQKYNINGVIAYPDNVRSNYITEENIIDGCPVCLQVEESHIFENTEERQPLKSLLLEFQADCLQYSQALRVGHCYAFPNLQMDNDRRHSMMVSISSTRPLLSLCFGSNRNECHAFPGSDLSGIAVKNEPCSVTLTEGSNKCYGPMFIANSSKERNTDEDCLKALLCYLRKSAEDLIPCALSVWEVDDNISKIQDQHLQNPFICNSGSLISVYGLVKHLSASDTQASLIILEVRDMNGLQEVVVKIDVTRVLLPLGLGSGTVASFFRVLPKWNGNERFYLECIPTTFVRVHRIDASNLWNDLQQNFDEIESTRPQYLISSLPKDEGMLLSIYCEIVAVQRLVIKKRVADSTNDLHSINFSFASFLVDDGSGLAECLAYGDRIAAILGLPSCEKSTDRKHSDELKTLCYILRKHDGYLDLKNEHSDDLRQNCSITTVIDGRNKLLSHGDQYVVNSFASRALHRPPLLLVCEKMRSLSKRVGGQRLKPSLMIKAVTSSSYAREAEKLSRQLEKCMNSSCT